MEEIAIPGHAMDLVALRFSARDGDVWIVGDGILNLEWLAAWSYYWPNAYGLDDIVETWRSVARILATADVVIPGHGPPIRVDANLLRVLLDAFSSAEHGWRCPEVADRLRERMERFHGLTH